MTSRTALLLVFAAFVGFTTAAEDAPQPPARLVWYHEAHCPTVNLRPMVRMKRVQAVREGLQPAPDCHPLLNVTYLGEINPGLSWGSSSGESEHLKPVEVSGYTRADGTYVSPYRRAKPGEAKKR